MIKHKIDNPAAYSREALDNLEAIGLYNFVYIDRFEDNRRISVNVLNTIDGLAYYEHEEVLCTIREDFDSVTELANHLTTILDDYSMPERYYLVDIKFFENVQITAYGPGISCYKVLTADQI